MNCCDGNCDQGRNCPNRKPMDFHKASIAVYNVIGYVAAAVAALTVVAVLVSI